MSNKLNNLLENEIKRFNQIMAYQKDLSLNEVSYKFYNEADEMEPEEPMVDEPTIDGTEGDMGNIPAEEPVTEPIEEPMVDEPTIDGTEGDMENIPAEEPVADQGTTEIDVTELVNTNNEIMGRIDGITAGLGRINDIVNKINTIEASLTKMDSVLGQLDSLTKQVELMRPPTEEERRKALTQDSYPFNVSIDDYNKGVGAKNQTELENTSKLSMLNTLMKDYNEMDVQRSFSLPNKIQFTER
jgi:hypothetical protein